VSLILTYLVGIRFANRKKETPQAYQAHRSLGLNTTAAYRLSEFEDTLTILKLFGGGDVFFQGGRGFVGFRVRKEGNLVVTVPVSATLDRPLPKSWHGSLCPKNTDTILSGSPMQSGGNLSRLGRFKTQQSNRLHIGEPLRIY
jgi:hypothetical protein